MAPSFHHYSLPFCTFLLWLYWLFLLLFSTSFSSSYKTGLVVTKSLSNCLSIKGFISPSFMKLSLARYEILSWKFFSLRILNIGPHSLVACRVSAKNPLWVWCSFLCGWLDLSLWLPLGSFLHFNPGESDNCVPWGCSSWGISLWCSLYFLDLNVGLPL